MNREILLIEPNYKNKYPPLSLMKLATYHKMLGDNVTFYKGSTMNFAADETLKLLIKILKNNDPKVNWESHRSDLLKYIKIGGDENLNRVNSLSRSPFDSLKNNPLVRMNLQGYRKYYQKKTYLENPQWDRICITTLFTFCWKETIETINFFKQFCKNLDQVFVGGVAATILPDAMAQEVGSEIRIIRGILDKGGEFDDNDIIIDELPLDYSILDEIDYKYPARDAYFGYMTRGCIRKCQFCVVPTLEPNYKSYISIKSQIEYVEKNFGAKKDLLLLDNNVFASEKFDEIIDEIKACGFEKGATYQVPNEYEIAYRNLQEGWADGTCRNDRAYIKKIIQIYDALEKKLSKDDAGDFYRERKENFLLEVETATK